ncbi:hypothetical protein MTX20_25410 [Bradyrhizobium sp. ISRA435]|nr:hypothetical protein MTX20_25410 [Bradyrhizobium sp. ISRA435]
MISTPVGSGSCGRRLRELRIAPFGEAYDFTGLPLHIGRFGRFENLEATPVDEERVIAEHAVQLRDGRVILGKHLGVELRHRLFHLCGTQLHVLLLFSWLRPGWFFPFLPSSSGVTELRTDPASKCSRARRNDHV